jgi:DNA-directed RNA polymerase subunit RPC12/RpoP
MDIKTVLIAFIATTLISALILTPISWPIGFSLWVTIVLASLLTVVRWHSIVTVYRCPECGHIFSISMVTDLFSPHGIGGSGGWKLLTCPKCGSYVRAHVLLKEETKLVE